MSVEPSHSRRLSLASTLAVIRQASGSHERLRPLVAGSVSRPHGLTSPPALSKRSRGRLPAARSYVASDGFSFFPPCFSVFPSFPSPFFPLPINLLKCLSVGLCQALVVCGLWDLLPNQRVNPGRAPALGVGSLSHWTTREVPALICRFIYLFLIGVKCP